MDFQKLIEFRNTHNPFAQKLGIVVEDVGEGTCRAAMPVREDELNPVAAVHGGALFTLADVTTGAAMASHGYFAVTVSANYNYLRSAALGDIVTAEAREVKGGKSLCVFDVTLTDQTGKLLGTGTFTYYRLDKPIEL